MPNTYPLSWPDGWRRTLSQNQKDAQFSHQKRDLTVANGVERVYEALRLLRVPDWNVIVSTNIEPRLDGTPRSGQPEPDDRGVAVYWRDPKTDIQRVMAVDQYKRVADNLGAIAATLEALRAIDRHGGAVILERAFMGFAQLPEPNNWRRIMGLEGTPQWLDARERYRELAKKLHPDSGGSDEAMAELNRALDDAKRELSA